MSTEDNKTVLDEEAVIALVERFLAAVGDGDLDALPPMFAPKANIGIASRRDGRWVTSTQTFDEWFTVIKARTTRTRFREPVKHFTVHVEDGQLAFVRADATIVVDGQVRSHIIDYFTLLQVNGAWKFVNASYTANPVAPH